MLRGGITALPGAPAAKYRSYFTKHLSRVTGIKFEVVTP